MKIFGQWRKRAAAAAARHEDRDSEVLLCRRHRDAKKALCAGYDQRLFGKVSTKEPNLPM